MLLNSVAYHVAELVSRSCSCCLYSSCGRACPAIGRKVLSSRLQDTLYCDRHAACQRCNREMKVPTKEIRRNGITVRGSCWGSEQHHRNPKLSLWPRVKASRDLGQASMLLFEELSTSPTAKSIFHVPSDSKNKHRNFGNSGLWKDPACPLP